jgi:hypothetical protein
MKERERGEEEKRREGERAIYSQSLLLSSNPHPQNKSKTIVAVGSNRIQQNPKSKPIKTQSNPTVWLQGGRKVIHTFRPS